MAITSIGGNVEGVEGWTTVSTTVDPGTGKKTIEYRGRIDTEEEAVEALKNAGVRWDKVDVSKSPDDATATITITQNEDGDTTPLSDDETAAPDITIQGSMLAVPLHQAPFFGLSATSASGSGLTTQQVRAIEYVINERGTIIEEECPATDLAKKYAAWRLLGMQTFDKPVYVMNVTYHLKRSAKDAVAGYLQTAGTVVDFSTACGKLNTAKMPAQPPGFDAWLVQAPTMVYTADGIDVTLTFVGAEAWPEYYTNGTWLAPSLASGSTSSSDSGDSSSGSESSESESGTTDESTEEATT